MRPAPTVRVMSTDLRTPDRRECERCGRVEVWEDAHWRIHETDDGGRVGDPFCIHEWDINGSFPPFDR